MKATIYTIQDLKIVLNQMDSAHVTNLIVRDENNDFIRFGYVNDKGVCSFGLSKFSTYEITNEKLFEENIINELKSYSPLHFIPCANRNHLIYEYKQELWKYIMSDLSGTNDWIKKMLGITSQHMFKPVRFENGIKGICVGCAFCVEDCFWMYITPDLKLRFVTSLYSIDELNEPDEVLSVLMRKQDLMEIVQQKKQEYFMNDDYMICLI